MTDASIDRPRPGDVAFLWWASHQPYDGNGKRNPRCDRGIMARLRRVSTAQEAAFEPATLDLHKRLRSARHRDGTLSVPELERTGLVAAVLSHVRADVPRGTDGPRPSTARLVGPDQDGKAILSPLRLRRLLAAQTIPETLVAFRRLVSLAGSTVPVGDLAETLLDWTDPRRRDSRRVRWVFDYHRAAVPDRVQDALEREDR